MSKYAALEAYLSACREEELTLSFSELEAILAQPLPPSARKYAAWWRNPDEGPERHSQALAWAHAGYRARPLLREEKAVFRRVDSARTPEGAAPYSSRAEAETPRPKEAPAVSAGEKELRVCGYSFRFIQQLIPDCEKGKALRFYPQKDYDNRKGLPLSRYGHGAFCRFSVRAPAAPGVYLWVCEGEIVYIGETTDLARRFNTGYGSIAPRNCYAGGQSTNCRMNQVVLACFEQGRPIELYFCETRDNKRVELELLNAIHTRYNVKDNTGRD